MITADREFHNIFILKKHQSPDIYFILRKKN